MRTMKSLLLGAAAGLVATAGAQAADLPVKAKAVEYVKICSAYGAGFYYIPGTDICLRVGGAVRADYYHHATGAFPDIGLGAGGSALGTNDLVDWVGSQNERHKETHPFRGRGYFILDARQNTAYGTLRAFANIYQSFTTSGTGASEGTNADRAFIQFAGFTFGRAQSFYDFYGSTGPHANLVTWNGQTTGATGWNVLAYTAQLGNGLSATLSMEDSRRKRVAFTSDANITDLFESNARAGQNVPAFVGNLRVDQAWGSAQIMGAVQELRTTEQFGSINSWGYAVGGGFTWNNPSAPGSQFGIQASWAKGALGYVANSYVGHVLNNNSTTAIGAITDGVVVDGSLEKTTGWGVNAGYQHRFSPNWAWTVHGGYTAISYNSAVEAAVVEDDLDYSYWSLGSRLLWTPVAGLDMGLDVMYHDFDSQSDDGGALPAGKTIGSTNVWSAMFRVQRNF